MRKKDAVDGVHAACFLVVEMRHYGAEGVEVRDNGSGIARENFAHVAQKHYTSKIASFEALSSLSTYGFRGEALFAMSSCAQLSVKTRQLSDPSGSRLEFDAEGNLLSVAPVAHSIGTSICVTNFWKNLPVRREQFLRNIRKEFARVLPIVQSYGLVCEGVRISLFNTTLVDKKQLVLSSSGLCLADNAVQLFNCDSVALDRVKTVLNVKDTNRSNIEIRMEGVLSPLNGNFGRRAKDRQFCFLNRRPVDLSSVGKIATELFRTAPQNSSKFPTLAFNFTLESDLVDWNVSPDKSSVFLSVEASLGDEVRRVLSAHYKSGSSVPIMMNAAASVTGFGTMMEKEKPATPAVSPGMLSRYVSAPAATPLNWNSSLNRTSSNPFSAFSYGKADSDPLPEAIAAVAKVRVNVPRAYGEHIETEKEKEEVEKDFLVIEEEPGEFCGAHSDEMKSIPEKEAVEMMVRKTSKRREILILEPDEDEPSKRNKVNGGDVGKVEFDLETVRLRLIALRNSGQYVPSQAPEFRSFEKCNFKGLTVIGQFNNGFILTRFESSRDLFIIDQHASNEIFNFENLQHSVSLRPQKLIASIPLCFSAEEACVVADNLNVFAHNGFLIESNDAFGSDFRLVAKPESKDVLFGEADARELLDLLIHSSGAAKSHLRPSRVRAMFASRACRLSVMIGDRLSMEKMQRIVADLASLESPWACPHGRPTFLHLFRYAD